MSKAKRFLAVVFASLAILVGTVGCIDPNSGSNFISEAVCGATEPGSGGGIYCDLAK